MRKHRKDWYCTNRPKISTKFKLPGYLRDKKLNKLSKKQLAALIEKRLKWLRSWTRNSKKLEQFYKYMLKRSRQIDQPGELPSFWQSLGFAGENPKDPAALARMRYRAEKGSMAWFAMLLSSRDPQLIAEGLKFRANALGKFDEALQMHADAAMTEIKANQQITQDVLEALPLAGEAVDLVTAWNGETLAGDKIGGWERFFRVACAAGPAAFEEALKRSPRLQKAMAGMVEATANMGRNTKNAMLEAAGINVKMADEILDATANFLTKERRLFKREAETAVRNAKRAYEASEAGMKEIKQMKKAREASKKTIDEISDLVKKGADPADIEKAVLKMQKDKIAQKFINSADDASDAVRKKVNETIKGIYKDVDAGTIKQLKNSDDVKALAKKHGLDPDSIEVEVWNPTNVRKTDVDPDFKKVGRDRDVTYQIVGKDKNGKLKRVDVDHDISGPAYKEEFYKRSHGGKLPPGDAAARKKAIDEFAEEMDQMVTSKHHLEAYNTGEVEVKDWLNNDIAPTVTRPEDIRDTIITKSDDWFKRAEKAGDAVQASKDTAEGMRQATKQYDNIILKRAKMYGANVPPNIQEAMNIFKQVDDMKITPKQAEAMLAELGKATGSKIPLTPKKAVEDMAHFLESLEKGPGKTFRHIKTVQLNKALKKAKNWDDATRMVNDALKSGHISGQTFVQLRAGVFKLPKNAPKEMADGLRKWAANAWAKRLISQTEKQLIEKQVGPLNGQK